MVEMEASWEFSECRADGVKGGRSIRGGVGGDSLPPRKRLLAGLRQNGWVSSLPGMVVSPGTEGFTHGVGEKVMPAADGEGKDGVVGADQEEGCTGCHSVGSNSELQRIKHVAFYLRLCKSCVLLYNKSMFCPHCVAMYHDASLLGDPALWLLCCCWGCSVHAECEKKQTPAARIDASSYVCPDCVTMASLHKETSNGLSGSRSKVSSGTVGVNCRMETGVSAAPATVAAGWSSPSYKKARMS